MKGEQLEHIRFQHPLYARTSLGVLGDYVTTRSGHGRGPHGAGPRRRRLQHRRPLRSRDLRAGRARAASSSTPWSCSPVSGCSTPTRTIEAGAEGTRPAVAPRRLLALVSALLALPQPGDLPGHVAVVHPHGRRAGNQRQDPAAGRAGRGRPGRQVDPGMGARPHLQHAHQPSRLVHLAPARVGCADPGGRLREVRRGDPDRGAGRAIGRAVFDEYGADAWYERPIEEFLPEGLTCPSCGGDRIRTRARHPGRLVRFRVEPRSGAAVPGRADLAGRHLSRRQRSAPRLVPELAAGRARHARTAAVQGGPHPRVPDRRGRPQDVQVDRQRDRAARR